MTTPRGQHCITLHWLDYCKTCLQNRSNLVKVLQLGGTRLSFKYFKCPPGLSKNKLSFPTWYRENDVVPDWWKRYVMRMWMSHMKTRSRDYILFLRAEKNLPGVYSNTSTPWGEVCSSDGLILCFKVSAVVLGTIMGTGQTWQIITLQQIVTSMCASLYVVLRVSQNVFNKFNYFPTLLLLKQYRVC